MTVARWPGQDEYERRQRERDEYQRHVNAEHDARQRATGGWTNAGHKVPLNLKTFHVTVHGLDDAHAALVLLWQRFGDHPDRTVSSSMTVTHGSVDGTDLKVVVDYLVRGGHPADLRRWLGKLFFGGPVTEEVVDARLVRTVQYVHGPLGPAREVVRKD